MEAVVPGPVDPVGDVTLTAIEQPFVGRWNQLISTTNWEKGRIISQWRAALMAAAAPVAEYSDDAWSRRVGGVTGQHVGRLRRVYERFGDTHGEYVDLYWSHFQAALDWEDAEMWLEGAVRSDWSVMQMRRTRWETLGAVPAQEPTEAASSAVEVDEDFVESADEAERSAEAASDYDGPRHEGPDFGDEDDAASAHDSDGAAVYTDDEDARDAIPFVQPFEQLGELPPDFAEAFDSLKLSMLRHKSEGWQQISCDDVLAALDALKELALAPHAE